MKQYKYLKDLPIFQNIQERTLQEMEQKGRIVDKKKGELILRKKERQDTVFLLMQGQAISYTLTRSGNRKIIFIHGSGELLNQNLISTDNSIIFCELIQNSRLFMLDNQIFCELMKQDFELVKTVLQVQEQKLLRVNHQLKNTIGNIYLEKKLAAKLWKLARDFGVPTENLKYDKKIISHTPLRIDISLTITFLADLLGAPRETTSRVCKSLAEKGLICVDKKTIIVNNMDCLANFYKNKCSENCPCKIEQRKTFCSKKEPD